MYTMYTNPRRGVCSGIVSVTAVVAATAALRATG